MQNVLYLTVSSTRHLPNTQIFQKHSKRFREALRSRFKSQSPKTSRQPFGENEDIALKHWLELWMQEEKHDYVCRQHCGCWWPSTAGCSDIHCSDVMINHRRLGCLLNRLFRHRSKKISKLRTTSLCEGNSPVTGGFPSQRASYAETISIWWRIIAGNVIAMFACRICPWRMFEELSQSGLLMHICVVKVGHLWIGQWLLGSGNGLFG